MYAASTTRRPNTRRLLAEVLEIALAEGSALVSPRTGEAAPNRDYYVGGYGEALVISAHELSGNFDGIVKRMVAHARSWGLKTSERHTYYRLRRYGDEIHFDLSERYSSFMRSVSVARERERASVLHGARSGDLAHATY